MHASMDFDWYMYKLYPGPIEEPEETSGLPACNIYDGTVCNTAVSVWPRWPPCARPSREGATANTPRSLVTLGGRRRAHDTSTRATPHSATHDT